MILEFETIYSNNLKIFNSFFTENKLKDLDKNQDIINLIKKIFKRWSFYLGSSLVRK